jgi:hypothetical protein
MKAHELARKLLDGPNLKVHVPIPENKNDVQPVIKIDTWGSKYYVPYDEYLVLQGTSEATDIKNPNAAI